MSGAPAPPDPVRLERQGSVGLLWLDDPPVNVLSARVLDRLAARLDEVEQDPTIRVLIVASARERAFAAGANIREMAPMGPAEARRHGARGQAVTVRIERLPIPVIAAVHGVCVGGGCEIALACDFIVASDDAVFGQPEINLGVMPGWGGTRRLPRRIGSARSRWWIYSGETVGAVEALQQGLLLKVVPRAELWASARALAETLAGKPAGALAAAKEAVLGSLDEERDRGLRRELALWSGLFGTADQREGMAAFLEKRPPRFGVRTVRSVRPPRRPTLRTGHHRRPAHRSGKHKR